MRSLTLIVAVAGAYALLRGWEGSPVLLLRSCLAVATLVAGLAFWGIRRDSSHPRMFSLRRPNWLDYLTLGAAIIFAEACFVVITSTLAAPVQQVVASVQENIADPDKAGGNGGENGDDGPDSTSRVSGRGLIDNDLIHNFSPHKTSKPSNKPEVFVELQNTADAIALLNSRIHLRSFALSRFNGTSWSATRLEQRQIPAPITFPKRGQNEVINYRIYHASNPTGQNLFTSLHGTLSTDLSELTQIAESIYQLPALDDPTDGYTYDASSSPIHFTDLINESIAPAQAQPEALELPPEFAEQLQKTGEQFIHEPNLARRLVAIKNHLQDEYTYSLEVTNAGGDNALRNFLYGEKRGYCEHFATAAAMLCRTIGVPSRVVYGWSGGRLYKEQNLFVFRAKDAHAWTEIKLEGYGWVVFDTTPPDNEATPEAHAAPEGEDAPDPMEAIAEHTPTDSNDTPFSLGIDPRVLYAALIVIGICCTAFLVTRAFKRPLTTPDGRPVHCPPPSYLTYFKQACATLGFPMPTGRTLRQHIDILQKNDAAPDFTSDMLDYHYDIIYAEGHKNPSIEKRFHQAIKRWKKSTLADRQTTFPDQAPL